MKNESIEGKVCCRCKEHKPKYDFYPAYSNNPDGKLCGRCKSCTSEYKKERRKDPRKYKMELDYAKDWHKKNPERSKSNHSSYIKRIRDDNTEIYQKRAEKQKEYSRKKILKSYGLTPDHYSLLLRLQGGVCAICEKPESREGYSLAVDHDHETGEVRGLLCHWCNCLLGILYNGEGFPIIDKMIEYIFDHKEVINLYLGETLNEE